MEQGEKQFSGCASTVRWQRMGGFAMIDTVDVRSLDAQTVLGVQRTGALAVSATAAMLHTLLLANAGGHQPPFFWSAVRSITMPIWFSIPRIDSLLSMVRYPVTEFTKGILGSDITRTTHLLPVTSFAKSPPALFTTYPLFGSGLLQIQSWTLAIAKSSCYV